MNVKNRNIFLYFALMISLIYLLVAYNNGSKQDAIYIQDYIRYTKSVQLLQASKFNDAKKTLDPLLKKHKNSYNVLWKYGLCLAGTGDTKNAESYLEKAKEIKPFLVYDQSFLVQMGEIKYRLKKYDEARKYFYIASKLNADSSLTKVSKQYLEKIQTN